jgi:excisionase family DNA binding protein
MRDIVGRKNLTSKQAARLLGVSEASVKRWADGGLLPALKTAGGHRRFRPEDVAAFRQGAAARQGEAASGDAAARTAASRSRHAAEAAPLDGSLSEAMYEMLLGGHDEEAASTLVSLYLHGHTVGRIADAALCPALYRVGELWQAGELSVAQEHIATRTALAALHALRVAVKAQSGAGSRAAVCCCVEEDFHDFPVHLASLVLEAQGWGVVNLGMNTPFFALSEAVARFRPRLVCVASTVFKQTDRAAREYADFLEVVKRVGASTALGGAGFSAEGERFPADLRATDFTQLEEFAAGLGLEDPAGD